ncbi:MAG: hypothetical protein AAGI63_17340 [Planctomycetota bacterium]
MSKASLNIALFVAMVLAQRCDAQDSEATRFRDQIESRGASVETIGVPGQFLAGDYPPPFCIHLSKTWGRHPISELNNELVRGIEIASDTDLTKKAFDELRSFEHLKWLSVDFEDRTWDVNTIGKIASLWSLTINHKWLDDVQLESLSMLSNLEQLSIENSRLSRHAATILKKDFRLMRLELKNNELEAPISDIVPPSVRTLILRGVTFSEGDVHYVAKMKSLYILDIRHCQISNESIEEIKRDGGMKLLLSGEWTGQEDGIEGELWLRDR